MDTKKWIIFAVVVFGVLGSLVFLAKKDQKNVSGVDQQKIMAASAASGNIADHVYGNKDSKTILIEYGDYQCPVCGQAHPIIKQVTEKFKDKIAFVYRNNPLTTIHPNARVAAAAAEAAGLQGQFWLMHDALYENQREWSNAGIDQRINFFVSYANKVGIKDIDKFKTDIGEKSVNDKINFDLALGKKVPVEGTPTLLLNGKKIDGTTWQNVDKFSKAIEDVL